MGRCSDPRKTSSWEVSAGYASGVCGGILLRAPQSGRSGPPHGGGDHIRVCIVSDTPRLVQPAGLAMSLLAGPQLGGTQRDALSQ